MSARGRPALILSDDFRQPGADERGGRTLLDVGVHLLEVSLEGERQARADI